MKIRTGDTVLIVAGKDKNKKGKVIKSLPTINKVVVDGLNIIKKHRKPKRAGEKGQKIEVARPIDVSNVKLICSRCGDSVRVGYKITEDGKARICKKCGSEI